MKAIIWALSAAVLCATHSAARAQGVLARPSWSPRSSSIPTVKGGLNHAKPESPGMPSVGGRFGPSMTGPGMPPVNGRIDAFGREQPGSPFGNTFFPPPGPTQPGMPPGNGPVDRFRPGFLDAPYRSTHEKAPKGFHNSTTNTTELPRPMELQLLVPSAVRPFEASRAPGGHRNSVEMPSWVRWQWVVGVLLLSFVIGTASGFVSRRQTGG